MKPKRDRPLTVVSPGSSAVGVLLTVAALAFSGPRGAGAIPTDTRQRLWDVRLDHLLKEPPGWTSLDRHETQAVAFSPDDKRLAVTLTHVQRASEKNFLINTHLLIAELHSPETNVQQFDLTQTCGVDLTWNQSGDAILVCGTILRLADGASCAVIAPPRDYPSLSREFGPYRAYWLDPDHVVRSTGEILDLDCHQVGTWRVDLGWQIRGLAASKGWVLVVHTEGSRTKTAWRYSIVDLVTHQALSGWPTGNVPAPRGRGGMAVGAEAFCFSLHDQNVLGSGKLNCRAINGGTEIPVPKEIRHFGLRLAAQSSSRIIVEKWEQDHDAWWVPSVGYPSLPRKRVALELLTGRLIASWKPGIQQSTDPHPEDWPYPCALSSTGELLAESGEGLVDLYRLVP